MERVGLEVEGVGVTTMAMAITAGQESTVVGECLMRVTRTATRNSRATEEKRQRNVSRSMCRGRDGPSGQRCEMRDEGTAARRKFEQRLDGRWPLVFSAK